MNKVELTIGIAVLVCGVVFMCLAYFVYYKEYSTYLFGNDSKMSLWQVLFGIVAPLVVIVVGISIMYDCFRPAKVQPPPSPPQP